MAEHQRDHATLITSGYEYLTQFSAMITEDADMRAVAATHNVPRAELVAFKVAAKIWAVYRVPEAERAKPGEPAKIGASFETVMETVYQERQHQERCKAEGGSHVAPMQNLAGYVLAMEYQLEQARVHWYHGSDPHKQAMHHIRKLVALGVAAGEQYGMPERESYHGD